MKLYWASHQPPGRIMSKVIFLISDLLLLVNIKTVWNLENSVGQFWLRCSSFYYFGLILAVAWRIFANQTTYIDCWWLTSVPARVDSWTHNARLCLAKHSVSSIVQHWFTLMSKLTDTSLELGKQTAGSSAAATDSSFINNFMRRKNYFDNWGVI